MNSGIAHSSAPSLLVLILLFGLGAQSCMKSEILNNPGETPTFAMTQQASESLVSGAIPEDSELVFTNIPTSLLENYLKEILNTRNSIFAKAKNGTADVHLSMDPLSRQITLTGRVKLKLQDIIGISLLGAPLDGSLDIHSFSVSVRPEVRYARDFNRSYSLRNQNSIPGTYSILDLHIISLKIDGTELKQFVSFASHLLSIVIASSGVRDLIIEPKGSPPPPSSAGLDVRDIAAKLLQSGALKVSQATTTLFPSAPNQETASSTQVHPVLSLELNLPKSVDMLKTLKPDTPVLKYILENTSFWAFTVSNHSLLGPQLSIAIGAGFPSQAWVHSRIKDQANLFRQVKLARMGSQYTKYSAKYFTDELKKKYNVMLHSEYVSNTSGVNPTLKEAFSSLIESMNKQAEIELNENNTESPYASNPKRHFDQLLKQSTKTLAAKLSSHIKQVKSAQMAWSQTNKSLSADGWPLVTIQLSERMLLQSARIAKNLTVDGVNLVKELTVKFSGNQEIPTIIVAGLLRVDFKKYLGTFATDPDHNNSYQNTNSRPTGLLANGIPFEIEIKLSRVLDQNTPKSMISIQRISLFDGAHRTDFDSSAKLGSVMFKLGLMIAATSLSSIEVDLPRKVAQVDVKRIAEEHLTAIKNSLTQLEKSILSTEKGAPTTAGTTSNLEIVMDLDSLNSPYQIDIKKIKRDESLEFEKSVLSSVFKANDNSLIIDLDLAKFTGGVFAGVDDLKIWHFEIASKRNLYRAPPMQDITFLEIALGRGAGSNAHSKYVAARKKEILDAVNNGTFPAHKENPVDLNVVMSLNDINHKISDMMAAANIDGAAAFTLFNTSYKTDSLRLSAVGSKDSEYGAVEKLKLDVQLKETGDKDQPRTIRITGTVGLRSLTRLETFKAIKIPPAEAIYGDQVLMVEFLKAPRVIVTPPLFPFASLINKISGTLFHSQWIEEGIPLSPAVIIAAAIAPVFSAKSPAKEGLVKIGTTHLNSFLKVKTDKGRIFLMINPRMIAPGISIQMLPSAEN